jgi:hypothetical protein
VETTEKFDCWAIVEVMGHSRYAGRVTEQAVGGCNFVRVDVPECEGSQAFTKLLGQASIFAMTPVTEEVARHVAKSIRAQPVHVFDLPSRSATAIGHDDDEETHDY